MLTFPARQASARFSELLRRCREEPVAITRHRRRAAVLISPEAFEEYERMKVLFNAGCLAAGIDKAIELMATGQSARGLGALRALAPFWRKAGVRSAPRLKKRPGLPPLREPAP
jgi:prevent-host-death family protein